MEIKTKKNTSGKILIGAALIFVGLLLLEDAIGFDISNHLIPFIIIGLGIYLMVRRRNQDLKYSADSHSEKLHKKMDDIHSKVNGFESNLDEKIDKFESKLDEKVNKFESKIDDFENKIHESFKSNGKIKYDKVFGDLFVNFNGINVENVEASSVFGNIELQMRKAIFNEGLNRIIISNFIGDIEIYIPKEIQVYVKCSNFIGDIEAMGKRSTGFGNNLETHSSGYDTASSKLYIASNCFIGDIHIIYV